MIRILNKYQPNPYPGIEIDTTSRGNNKDLSPFFLGPVKTYNEDTAMNVENYWQYSKVYVDYTIPPKGLELLNNSMMYEPSPAYFDWRDNGWHTRRAVRYPMGKGAKPLYSLYQDHKLDYITARKVIYIPAYASAVIRTETYHMLYDAVLSGQDVVLRDFDGYDYISMNMILKDVVNNPDRNMGHAFVLAMLLTGEIHECMKL